MAFDFKKYIQISVHLIKSNLMQDMAYPIPYLSKIFSVFLVMVLNIVFINVSFKYIHSLAGWSYFQVLGVIGSYMIVDGIMWVLFSQLSMVNNFIKEGNLDGILLKPIDSQFMLSFWRGDSEDVTRCIIGVVLIVIAIKNTIGFHLVNLLLFLILLLSGVIILYSLNLFFRSISFWVIDGAGVWFLVERVTSNSQFPTDIYYHKIVRGIFTFIIPLAFIATVPAKILTNVVIDYKLVLISFLMCALFFSVSRLFWKFSLKHYSSASS